MYSPGEDSPRSLPYTLAFGSGTSASLTYEPFYGLREKPFSLSADPRFLYMSPAHAPAFDALLAGIRRREGLVVLTGEIGTGKTTLCRSVLQQLDRRTFSAFVPDPFVSREDLLKTLLVDFGVISISDLTRGRFNGASRSELSYPLYEFLDSLVPLQAFAVLVIDETQNLSLPLLEELRILSELERREKLLQVVLVGQPELRSSLRLPQMRQVDQRVSVRCELTALDADGVAGYVNHRLAVAGSGDSGVQFTPSALDALHQGSAGVPRVINRLCDRALEHAYAARSRQIDAEFVSRAIDDLGFAPESHGISAQKPAATESPVQAPKPATTHAVVQAPTPQPAVEALAIAGAQATAPSPLLDEFMSEAELPARPFDSTAQSIAQGRPASIGRAPGGHRWAAVATASIVAVASVGVPAWYLRTRMVNDQVTALARPPLSPDMFSTPAVMPPNVDGGDQGSSPENDSAQASENPAAEDGRYTIAVASFTSRERAERLVDELTNAGYRARAVERDWGPPRGRLVQVNVVGYASEIDVQRDLQQIRELPGGYRDARIVERQ